MSSPKDLSRRLLTLFRPDSLAGVLFRLRFEPKPDAGDLGEADFLGGVVKGDDALRVLYGLLFDGAITRSTPVEYRLRPRKRAAIDNASAET